MFETLFGVEVPHALKAVLAIVFVLALIGVTFWVIRRFGADHFGASASRGRQPRLAVVDQASVDARRRLVIVRRDNVEHLLMIGGPTDVVVESNIVRAMGVPRDKSADSLRPPAIPETVRNVPLGDGTLWPLQPQPAMPETELAPRATTRPEPTRPAAFEPEQPPRAMPRTETSRPAALASDHALRATPRVETSRPAPSIAEIGAPAAQPKAPAEHSAAAAAGGDPNLDDMAQRLEAALRRPNGSPEQPAPTDTNVKAQTGSPRAPANEPKAAKMESKPAAPKSLYDSLEQEMASLLGRPPGKT